MHRTDAKSVSSEEATTLYRLLADNAREMVSCHAFDLTFLYASPAASRVLGRDPSDLVGQRLDDLVHPDDLAGVVSSFTMASEGDQQISTVMRVRSCDGSWRWFETFLRGVENPESGQVEIHATTHDITKYKQIEKAIERVAKEWRGTFDSARDAILMLDRRARIIRVNLATTRLFDCEFADLLGCSLHEVVQERLGLNDPFGIEEAWESLAQVRRDVSLGDDGLWVRSTVDPVLDASGEVRGGVIFLSNITTEKVAEVQLRETLSQLRRLSSHLQVVRDQERKSIAREVHDELGHALTALKMDVAWLAKRVSDTDAGLTARTQGMTALIDQLIATVRRISTALSPPVLDDLGLAAALEWMANDFQERTGITTRIELPTEPQRFTSSRESTVFRIVQECLTNIARHAGAAEVDIGWRQDDETVELRVADDGCGFEASAATHKPGLGLLGMAERARDLSGRLQIDSRPGEGCIIRVTFPCQVDT